MTHFRIHDNPGNDPGKTINYAVSGAIKASASQANVRGLVLASAGDSAMNSACTTRR